MTTPLEAIKAAIEALEPFAKAWDAAMRFQNPATLAEFGAIAKHHVSSVDFLRARAAHALLSQVEAALASTPPKPAAEDVVERVANAIAAWRHEALDAFKVCGPRETSRADRSLANTLAAANLLRTDKEPS